MAVPVSLIPDKTIEDVKSDFRAAERIEQYRLGEKAVYLPAGMRWNYIPRSEILEAAPSHRTVSAGHCVTVRVQTPALELVTAAGPVELHLEKQASLDKFLAALKTET